MRVGPMMRVHDEHSAIAASTFPGFIVRSAAFFGRRTRRLAIEKPPNQWPVCFHKTRHPTYWNLTEISWFECSPDEVDLFVYAGGQFDTVTRSDYQYLDSRTDQSIVDRIV